MLEARLDRTTVALREALAWILLADFAAPLPVDPDPAPPWRRPAQAGPGADALRAREDLLVALRDGDLHATGRYSDTPAAPWEASHHGRTWILHSGRHTSIPAEAWRQGRYDWARDALDLPGGQYLDVRVPRFLVRAIWPPPATGGPAAPGAYTTPYLELMRRAIAELGITAGRQPKKETVVAWFRTQTLERTPISANFARHLATFVRLPEAQRGGNRKWRPEADRATAAPGSARAASGRVTPAPATGAGLGGTVAPADGMEGDTRER